MSTAQQTYGFEPTDADVDECILDAAKTLTFGRAQAYDWFFVRVRSMVCGDLKHKHFTDRMLDLQGMKLLIRVRDKIDGKGKVFNLYRLRVDTDNERPRWR